MKAGTARKNVWRVWTAGVAVGLLAGTVVGEGFRNPPEGAAALGRGGVRFVYADDATAAAHNPANLVELGEPCAAASVTVIDGTKEFTSPLDNRKTESKTPMSVLPGVYASWPLQGGDYAAGLAISSPYGQRTEWEKGSIPGLFNAYDASLRVVNVNPSLAGKVNENLAVGVGIDLLWSDIELNQFVHADADGIPEGTGKTDADGTAVSWNLGASWQATERQRLALTYRMGFDIEYEGDMELAGIAALKTDFETEINFPSAVGLGYGLQVSDAVYLGVDVEWVENSRYDQAELKLNTADPALMGAVMANPALAGALSAMPTVIPQDWDDTWTVGVGVDWQFAPSWTWRCGGSFVESPMRDQTLLPYMAEGDQTFLAAGLGYWGEHGRLDVAYGHGFFDDRDVTDNQTPVYNGTYEFSSDMFAAAYAWQF